MDNVYIVDDDGAVRDSLSMLLKAEDFNATQFSKPVDFLEFISEVNDGVILLDLCMPIMSGIEVMEELKRRGNTMPVICITGHGDVPTAVKALKMGACDFLEKPYESSKLIERIKQCIEDQKNQRQQEDYTLSAKHKIEKLTPKEYEVLEGLVDGKMNKQIAYNMGISIRTAELHRAHLLEKLEARSLSDVVKIAMAAKI